MGNDASNQLHLFSIIYDWFAWFLRLESNGNILKFYFTNADTYIVNEYTYYS